MKHGSSLFSDCFLFLTCFTQCNFLCACSSTLHHEHPCNMIKPKYFPSRVVELGKHASEAQETVNGMQFHHGRETVTKTRHTQVGAWVQLFRDHTRCPQLSVASSGGWPFGGWLLPVRKWVGVNIYAEQKKKKKKKRHKLIKTLHIQKYMQRLKLEKDYEIQRDLIA